MRISTFLTTFALAATIGLLGAPADALDEILDRRIPYQGRLEGVTGTTNVVVELYDGAVGGTRVWGPEFHVVTPDAEGRFLLVIGSTGLDLCARQPDESLLCGTGDGLADLDQIPVAALHLAIQIDDGTTTTALTPRQPLFPSFAASSVVEGSISFESLAEEVRTGRIYRQNDVLLRRGPCPPGYFTLGRSNSSSEIWTIGLRSDVPEGGGGSHFEFVVEEGGAFSFTIEPLAMTACVCQLDVCR
jgi:hypothetical protein